MYVDRRSMRKFWQIDLVRHCSPVKEEEVHKTHRKSSTGTNQEAKHRRVRTKNSERKRKKYTLIYPQKTGGLGENEDFLFR